MKAKQEIKCFGIFGKIKLKKFEYLILISEVELFGQLLTSNSEILKVGQLLYLPLGSDKMEVAGEDQSFVDMI